MTTNLPKLSRQDGPRPDFTKERVRQSEVRATPRVTFRTEPAKKIPKEESPPTHRSMRYFIEAIVVLALAVSVFRTFIVEGFMISTGSMAPRIRGYHYRITCPDCQFSFAHTATEISPEKDPQHNPAGHHLTCPNCHYDRILLSGQPINEGDQILVDKQAYEWRSPERWDAIVFRNPQLPAQAYSKRIVGLPGETLQLREGDVFINGDIQRKGLLAQRQMRILVTDSRYQPQLQDENWRSPWSIEPNSEDPSWQIQKDGFHFEPSVTSQASENVSQQWLTYKNWVRRGGGHRYRVPLKDWPIDLPLPSENAVLRFDSTEKELSCRGALPADIVEKLRVLTVDTTFHDALIQLFEQSHLRPITDWEAYNEQSGLIPMTVSDVMVRMEVSAASPQSQIQLRLNDGWYDFQCRFDFTKRIAELSLHGQKKILRVGDLPELPFEEMIEIEMSVMDRQVLVAVNGEVLFEPYAYRAEKETRDEVVDPVHVQCQDGPVSIARMQVFRDIAYRKSADDLEISEASTKYKIGPDEYFVLGDNSIVSIDSRYWPRGSVKPSLIIGRPLVLHLPSRKQIIEIGSLKTQIRVPDFDRVRMLR